MKENSKNVIIALELVCLIILTIWIIFISINHTSPVSTTTDSLDTEELDFLGDEENILPIVGISADVTSGKAPLNVAFKSTASDEDGEIITYAWDFDDGKQSDKQNPTHVFEALGTYDVILTVTDDKGGSARDTIKIRVIKNNPPIAYATYYTNRLYFNQTAPIIVYFNGKGTDDDGTIVSYHWDFGPQYLSIIPYYTFGSWRYRDNVPFYLSKYDSDEQDPIRILYQPGYYWAKLTVTDNDGATDTDTVNIYVYNIASTVKETVKKMVLKR